MKTETKLFIIVGPAGSNKNLIAERIAESYISRGAKVHIVHEVKKPMFIYDDTTDAVRILTSNIRYFIPPESYKRICVINLW